MEQYQTMIIDEQKLFEQIVNTVNNYKDDFSAEDCFVLEELNRIFNEKWITIKGNHILLKDGETIADAFKRHTGVSIQKDNNPEKTTRIGGSKTYKEILTRLEQDNKKNITTNDIIRNAAKNNGWSEKEIQSKIENAIEYNYNIGKTKRETYKYYSDGKGHYDKNRMKLHKKILNDIFMHSQNAKPKEGQKPTFMMLGGRAIMKKKGGAIMTEDEKQEAKAMFLKTFNYDPDEDEVDAKYDEEFNRWCDEECGK